MQKIGRAPRPHKNKRVQRRLDYLTELGRRHTDEEREELALLFRLIGLGGSGLGGRPNND